MSYLQAIFVLPVLQHFRELYIAHPSSIQVNQLGILRELELFLIAEILYINTNLVNLESFSQIGILNL